MRCPIVWLLLAGAVAALRSAQEHEACFQTGYFDGGNPCTAPSQGGVWPPGCARFLKDLPHACRSLLAVMLTPQATYLLDSDCGTGAIGSSSASSGDYQLIARSLLALEDPSADGVRPTLLNPKLCAVYYPSRVVKSYSEICSATKYRNRRGDCDFSCKDALQAIIPECVAYVLYLGPGSLRDTYTNLCGLTIPAVPSPSPAQVPPSPEPSPALIPLAPGAPPPLPPPASTPVEIPPDSRSAGPGPAPAEPLAPADFTCEGDFSWIDLTPGQASQWGDAAPETGADVALAGKCSWLHVEDEQTHAGCCAETRVDLYPWWQYDLASERQVKGIRLKPPQDIACCVDAACTQPGPCFDRLEPSVLTVGNVSLPDFYASQDYSDLLAAVVGNTTLAQAGVVVALQAGSTLCNAVTAINLLDSANKAVDHVSVGCGQGLDGGGSATDVRGRFVTITQDTIAQESLALCGIQICATS